MGVFDKIKNALFEVEYVEVEEKPKKDKRVRGKEKSFDAERLEKPIAKKIVLPGKREEKVEEIEEEDLKDDNFEARPKDEMVKEVFSDDFKVMEDDDFVAPEPSVVSVPAVPTVPETTPAVEEVSVSSAYPTEEAPSNYLTGAYSKKNYKNDYDNYLEKGKSGLSPYSGKDKESKPYGLDPSYQVSIHEYGSVNKDDKGIFRPSPIISPIYGILDKNYKKEDIVTKKETRIISNVPRANVNVDDIRNKAYGRRSDKNKEEDIPEVEENEVLKEPPSFEVEEEEENLLVDLSDEKKPEVKEITVGDAMEYFQDLGLEYNVDYMDASGKNVKKKNEDLEEEIENNMGEEEDPDVPVISKVVEDAPAIIDEATDRFVVQNKEEENVVEVVDESKEESSLEDDDNLFDLIDSMYKEEQ